MLCFQLQPDLLNTVVKILRRADPVKIIRDTVCVNLGIQRQLINEPVHVHRLVVDRAHIFVCFFRCVRNPVQDPFHIALDRCNRRF